MPMKPPRFWAQQPDPYAREAAPVTRAMLTPLAWLYGAGFVSKQARAKPKSVAAYVICVGNLTVGGSGKTPFVRYLRAALADTGVRVATLSRGYGGRLKTVVKIDSEKHTAQDVGDEPRMLAQDGESWIGADRFAAAQAMADDGVEIIIMDDGFQNWALEKDYNILVFDGGDPVGNGCLLPKGPLREPIKSGLARADLAIFMGQNTDNRDYASWPVAQTLSLDIETASLDTSKRYVAFAGIGRPQKFFDSLAKTGADICEAVSYADHYPYKPKDLSFLRTLAGEYQADLITTEKDWVRLLPSQRENIAYLGIKLAVSPALNTWLAAFKNTLQKG